MNNLMKEMKRSLRELDLGLKGELTISSDMEDLSNSLFFDQVHFYLLSICIFNMYTRYLQPGLSLPMPQCMVYQLGMQIFW